MKWGKLLLLIVALIFLSGYYYFHEVRGKTQRKLAEEKKKEEAWQRSQVFPYQPQDFKWIRLVKDAKAIEYRKEDNVWWMREPTSIKGNEKAVDDIIHSIIDVVETDPVEDNPSDLAQFGLDRPIMEISVQLEGGGEPHTVFFGIENPAFTTIYAQVKGSPKVFLVGSLIRWEVSKEFYNLSNQSGPFSPDKNGT